MTTTPDACECCGQPIASVGHLTDEAYPPGVVWCRPCWRDWLLGRALGIEVECSRTDTSTIESIDLATGVRTTITPEGVNVSPPIRERVVWAGPGEPPDWLTPALDQHDQEGEDDDDTEHAA